MIAFVDQSGQLGGAELCLADLARHYGSRGRVVLFAEGPFAEHLRQLGVEVTVVPLPGALARTTREASLATLAMGVPAVGLHVLQLRKEFRDARLLYFNTAKALLHGMAANLGCRRAKQTTVFHLHDLLLPEHFSRVNLRLLVAAANRANAVIANSQASANAFVAAGGRAPVTVIPNGFDPVPFDAVSQAEIDALRAEFNPENRPVAAIFGRLARWKGQDVLLRAAARCPDLMIWVVGDALFTGDDRAYAEELRRTAGSLGDRVRFLGFRRDIPALMRAVDLVVHCSVAPEPFGRVLVEGMLARKPVIATQGGGADEIVEGVGLLVPPNDDTALAEALLGFSESERETMACSGRKRAENLYSLPAVLQKTDKLLSSLLP